MHQFLSYSAEVANARAAGKPVVALESTIISHGMPYPQNVQTAKEVEQIIRDAGAVPATIAIIGGKICIGLSPEQLELLGNSPDAMKVSRRDLPYVLSAGVCWSIYQGSSDLTLACRRGLKVAAMTLESPDTVSPLLAADILDEINEFHL